MRRIRGVAWLFVFGDSVFRLPYVRFEIRLDCWLFSVFWDLGLVGKGRFGFLEAYMVICHIQFTCTYLRLLIYVLRILFATYV